MGNILKFDPPKCRFCHRTDLADCVDTDGSPSWWMDETLCSACAEYLFGNPILEELGLKRREQDQRFNFNVDQMTPADLACFARALLSIVVEDEADISTNRDRLIESAAMLVAAVEIIDACNAKFEGNQKDSDNG